MSKKINEQLFLLFCGIGILFCMRPIDYRAKKSLGQHFLHDGNIARNIIAELRPDAGEQIIEIGSGKGILTSLLVKSAAQIIAVDVDSRSIDALREQFSSEDVGNVTLLQADILKVDIKTLFPESAKRIRIIGNLPYHITSPILFHFFAQHEQISDAVFMIQREVADRLVALHGGKDYGILSVMTQVHARVRRCFHVSPNVFTPKPKVWSSVVHLEFHDTLLQEIKNYSFFRYFVKTAFGKRRKILANTLRSANIDITVLQDLHSHWLQKRPEQIPVSDFISLSNILEGYERAHE